MSDKKIDITAKEITTVTSDQAKSASVSIKNVTGDVIRNKEYTTKVPTGSVQSTLVGATQDIIAAVNQNAITTQVPLDNLEFNLIGFGETSIPTSGKFKRKQDYFTYSDLSTISIQRLIIENKVVTDIFSRQVDFIRPFFDLANIQESFQTVVNYNRIFNNSTDISDEQRINLNKLTLDNLTSTDVSTIALTKVFNNTSQTSDLFFKKEFDKLVLEVADVSEEPRLNLSTPREEFIISLDQEFLSLSLLKLENVGFTDVRNITIDKVAISEVDSIDTPSLNTSKVLFSLLSGIQDTVSTAWSVNRTFTDLSTTNDFFSRVVEFNRDLLDQSVSSELIRFDTSVVRSDSTTPSDSTELVTDFNRLFTDVTNSSEVLSVNLSTVLNDTFISSELSSKETDKVLSTEFTKSDLITNITTTKNILENIVSVDLINIFKYTQRIFLESKQFTDSGFINNQNYFAEAYVEPGYVGTNTYFT